jgi:hypothetical protein
MPLLEPVIRMTLSSMPDTRCFLLYLFVELRGASVINCCWDQSKMLGNNRLRSNFGAPATSKSIASALCSNGLRTNHQQSITEAPPTVGDGSTQRPHPHQIRLRLLQQILFPMERGAVHANAEEHAIQILDWLFSGLNRRVESIRKEHVRDFGLL